MGIGAKGVVLVWVGLSWCEYTIGAQEVVLV